MKRTIIALSIAAFIPSAHATGIPVVDVLANGLAIEHAIEVMAEWAKQAAAYKKEYDMLMNQYTTLQAQLGAIRGNYGYGAVLLYESSTASKIVPGSWQDVVAQQAQGQYGSKLAAAEQLLNTLAKEEAGKTTQRGQTYAMSSNAVRSSMASADALYTEAQQHLLAIDRLSKEVDKAPNIKAAQDLRNRIAIETAMLDAATSKMNAINLNLQANAVNGQNQATAVSHRFYQWNAAAK